MSSDEARVILEAFDNKIAVVVEMFDDLKKNMATKDDIQELRSDIHVTQKALRATNEDLREQGAAITRLNQQIAG